MVQYDDQLIEKLKSIGLPVLYEQFVDSTVKTPVITYFPINNSDYLMGDNLFYYKIDYYIKLWGHYKKDLIPYNEEIRTIMRESGFRCSSYNELATDTGICLVGLYKATGYEKL